MDGRLIYRMSISWFVLLIVSFSTVLAADQPPKPVRNVIVLVMDGAAAGPVTMARWTKGSPLFLDRMLVSGVHTFSSDSLVTDSAASVTASACLIASSASALAICAFDWFSPITTCVSWP